MPQMNKGGKFIFGKSLIRTDGTLRIPPQAMEEYHIADEGKVYLFTGSKITGGFCVTRKGLLHPSKLGHILDDTPPLLDYSAGSGEFIKYKGRSYCWVASWPASARSPCPKSPRAWGLPGRSSTATNSSSPSPTAAG